MLPGRCCRANKSVMFQSENNFLKLINYFFIEVQLIYNVSGVQQSDSVYIYIYVYIYKYIYIYIFFFRFFSIMVYSRILNKVACFIQQALVLYLFFKINKFIYLFIFGCVGSSLLRAGFLQLQRAGATLRCST